jgi:hypothetical protein
METKMRVSNWKSIETAPRDINIDVWLHNFEHNVGQRVADAYFCSEDYWSSSATPPKYPLWDNSEAEGWGLYLQGYVPTHWMPVPDSPYTIE